MKFEYPIILGHPIIFVYPIIFVCPIICIPYNICTPHNICVPHIIFLMLMVCTVNICSLDCLVVVNCQHCSILTGNKVNRSSSHLFRTTQMANVQTAQLLSKMKVSKWYASSKKYDFIQNSHCMQTKLAGSTPQ